MSLVQEEWRKVRRGSHQKSDPPPVQPTGRVNPPKIQPAGRNELPTAQLQVEMTSPAHGKIRKAAQPTGTVEMATHHSAHG
jgi:hypothetical protein